MFSKINNLPIRWRLTFWFSLILCITLILCGVLLYFFLQNRLYDDVDNDLRVYSAKVHGTLDTKEIPQPLDFDVIHSSLPPINELTSPGIYIQFINKNGETLVKSSNLGDAELPISYPLISNGFEGKVDIQTVPIENNGHVRIMVSPMYLVDQTLLLEVAKSMQYVDTFMNQIGLVLIAVIVMALLIAGISGAIIVRRALSPVQRITGIVRGIEASSDLSQRVNYKGPMDEVGSLATTFDHMIEHLDKVFRSQKNFVADASHELKTPLTVIKGNLDLLNRADLTENDRYACVLAVRVETEKMIAMVNDLLLLAEIDTRHIDMQDDVSINKLLLDGYERAKQLEGKRTIHVQNTGEDLIIKGNALRLKQVIWNLVDNAIKYNSNEGVIRLSSFRDEGYACIQVSDNGIGISKEDLPSIFDRFYRADKARSRKKGGIGLGLAIVKEIIDQHGGRIKVESEPGKGSTFSIYLNF